MKIAWVNTKVHEYKTCQWTILHALWYLPSPQNFILIKLEIACESSKKPSRELWQIWGAEGRESNTDSLRFTTDSLMHLSLIDDSTWIAFPKWKLDVLIGQLRFLYLKYQMINNIRVVWGYCKVDTWNIEIKMLGLFWCKKLSSIHCFPYYSCMWTFWRPLTYVTGPKQDEEGWDWLSLKRFHLLLKLWIPVCKAERLNMLEWFQNSLPAFRVKLKFIS